MIRDAIVNSRLLKDYENQSDTFFVLSGATAKSNSLNGKTSHTVSFWLKQVNILDRVESYKIRANRDSLVKKSYMKIQKDF